MKAKPMLIFKRQSTSDLFRAQTNKACKNKQHANAYDTILQLAVLEPRDYLTFIAACRENLASHVLCMSFVSARGIVDLHVCLLS